jgi:prepilin signal peptidase PulO-like enzyme (type II secretory pathway)
MLIIAITIAVSILLAVGIHYEALSLASNCMRSIPLGHRVRVAAAVLAALGAHFLEVIAFALGWKLLLALGEARLSIGDPSFVQLLYFSSATYTSLGYGDIVPLGDAGLFAGSEAVTGLVLIAWTASFTYFEMRAYWDDAEQR